MKNSFFVIIILLAVSCGQNRKPKQFKSINKLEDNISKTKASNVKIKKREASFDTIIIFPTDTLIDNFNLKFIQISENDYYTQKKKEIETKFEQDNADSYLAKKDSCYYLNLNNKGKDTLCDFDDGEYYETYALRGFSKKTNTLIFDWKNWEEAHSILINLNENKHWILNPEYKISPNNKKLIAFLNNIDHPIYEKNGLSLYELTEGFVSPIYHFSNQKYGVFDINWISLNKILIHLKKIDFENYKAKESYYFFMIIKED